MRITLTIDDTLFAKAMALVAPGTDEAELLKQCVEAFVRQQTARHLADLGGEAPDVALPPRRREEPPES
jgi:hypothetical protein